MRLSPSLSPNWKLLSLASSLLGWLGALPLPFIDYQAISGATAGVGLVAPFLLGVLSSALGLTGVLCGVVALGRIRRDKRRGRSLAWTGILLGGLLLATYGVVLVC